MDLATPFLIGNDVAFLYINSNKNDKKQNIYAYLSKISQIYLMFYRVTESPFFF